MTAETLDQRIDAYSLENEITEDYEYQLRYAARRLSRYLERLATTDDLTPAVANGWLRSEQRKDELGDRSRRNLRASLLTIWKAAKLPLACDEIRSVAVTAKAPEAWRFEELQLVAGAASKMDGVLANGLRRSEYFSALIWFTFETGLRRSDVFKFDVTSFDGDNRAALTQQKTGRIHVVEATAETVAELQRMAAGLQSFGDKNWQTPLRWPQSTSTLYTWIRKIRTIAGVDSRQKNRSLQHLRRTGATAVECAEPEGGSKYLGHAGRELAWKSYIDPRKATRSRLPPTNRHHEQKRSGQ